MDTSLLWTDFPLGEERPFSLHSTSLIPGLSLTFQVAGEIHQVAGESNRYEFLLVLFFFYFQMKVAGGHIHGRLDFRRLPGPVLILPEQRLVIEPTFMVARENPQSPALNDSPVNTDTHLI